jgi:hypothetical protein
VPTAKAALKEPEDSVALACRLVVDAKAMGIDPTESYRIEIRHERQREYQYHRVHVFKP